MKIQDFTGKTPDARWFQLLVEWTRKKISFDDNIDCQILGVSLKTTETVVGHSLGRTPRYIIEMAAYPNGTAGIEFTQPPSNSQLFLKRTVAGNSTLMLL